MPNKAWMTSAALIVCLLGVASCGDSADRGDDQSTTSSGDAAGETGGAPATDRATAIVDHSARNGLILLKAGPAGNCIRVLVPLNISDDQIDEAIEILDAALVATA